MFMTTYENKELFDFSSCSKDSNCYDNLNNCRKVKLLIKYENNALFNRSYMRHELSKIQVKDLNAELIKFYCLVMMNDKKHILGDG